MKPFRHTECVRLYLFDAAHELRSLLNSGWVIPNPLRLQIEATIAALVAEADARGPSE